MFAVAADSQPNTPHYDTHYKTLGLPLFADADAVKAAYRKLARQWHPDLNPAMRDKAEEMLKTINQAYVILSQPEKKKLYDEGMRLKQDVLQQRAQSAKASSPAPPPAAKPTPAPPPPAPSPTQVQVAKHLERFLKAPFAKNANAPGATPSPVDRKKYTAQQGNSQKQAPQKGQAITVTVVLTPPEAAGGCIKSLQVDHHPWCRKCGATGRLNGRYCAGCNGVGHLVETHRLEVEIPAGVTEGAKVRISGEGQPGRQGGEPGDLFLLVRLEQPAAAQAPAPEPLRQHVQNPIPPIRPKSTPIEPKETPAKVTDSVEASPFRIDGLTVHYTLTLSWVMALMGHTLDVPTLHGPVAMTIPPRTTDGRVLRLKGQGVWQAQQKGDQLVTIHLQMPESLTPEEKALYQQLLAIELARD